MSDKNEEILSIDKILTIASSVNEGLETLRDKKNCVVMFVDLVDSTNYKDLHPKEEDWLVRLAVFLNTITNIISQEGRVVKYIGDEVMGIFEGERGILSAEHAAEQIFEFCSQYSTHLYEVKIALDYGEVSMMKSYGVTDSALNGDPQGIVVDRSARIMSKCVANIALSSKQFYEKSKAKKRWKACGSFTPKGIKNKLYVYKLQYSKGADIKIAISDEKLSMKECLKKIDEQDRIIEMLKSIR